MSVEVKWPKCSAGEYTKNGVKWCKLRLTTPSLYLAGLGIQHLVVWGGCEIIGRFFVWEF